MYAHQLPQRRVINQPLLELPIFKKGLLQIDNQAKDFQDDHVILPGVNSGCTFPRGNYHVTLDRIFHPKI